MSSLMSQMTFFISLVIVFGVPTNVADMIPAAIVCLIDSVSVTTLVYFGLWPIKSNIEC